MRYRNHRQWRPSGAEYTYDRFPPIGAVIALDRRPWRVVATSVLDRAEWTDDERAADHIYRPPGALTLDPLPEGPRHRLRVHANAYITWVVIGEHYAVCNTCGELHPCRHITARAEAERARKELDRLTRIAPGCCWACAEPVTRRQKHVVFPGANLLLPGADPPVFHTRRACIDRAADYEDQWVAADPDRRRLLERIPE